MAPQPKRDARVGRRYGESVQIRMASEQSAVVEARAGRLGVSFSEAARQLLALGAPLEQGEAHGLVVAPDVAGAIGWGAIAWVWDLSDDQVDALPGLAAEAAAALREGAVLLTTAETAMALRGLE